MVLVPALRAGTSFRALGLRYLPGGRGVTSPYLMKVKLGASRTKRFINFRKMYPLQLLINRYPSQLHQLTQNGIAAIFSQPLGLQRFFFKEFRRVINWQTICIISCCDGSKVNPCRYKHCSIFLTLAEIGFWVPNVIDVMSSASFR